MFCGCFWPSKTSKNQSENKPVESSLVACLDPGSIPGDSTEYPYLVLLAPIKGCSLDASVGIFLPFSSGFPIPDVGLSRFLIISPL